MSDVSNERGVLCAPHFPGEEDMSDTLTEERVREWIALAKKQMGLSAIGTMRICEDWLRLRAERDHWQSLWSDVNATVGAAENYAKAAVADRDHVSAEAKREYDRLRAELAAANARADAATQAERERCAKIADGERNTQRSIVDDNVHDWRNMACQHAAEIAEIISERIRAGGQP